MTDTITTITKRIRTRSQTTRAAYLARMEKAASHDPHRHGLACGNIAHGLAGCTQQDKDRLIGTVKNIAIISAYNDILSAHQPFERFPAIIKHAAETHGAVAQFAGGVPAMCDGVTQGQTGMELSLFSRDVIAMSTAIALSHNLFDAAVCLGICDKIVPGLLIGALSFGHLPIAFIPGGPMPSGISNKEKQAIRERYAKGEVGRDALLASEMAAYHAPGTCTFYGTANSNQMLMEIMGLQLPGGSFVNPDLPLRDALTSEATRRVISDTPPLYKLLDERSIVNAIVGLLATGGSTNHTIHLIAIAKAAGILINWDDFAALSEITPLIARVYPSGEADINQFHAAGGMGLVIRELLSAKLLHGDALTLTGKTLAESYLTEPFLEGKKLIWREAARDSGDTTILRPASDPFLPHGGLVTLTGNIGRAIIKTSALKPEHYITEAPAKVFHSQDALLDAFKAGKLNGDMVAVITHQGPRANGMPELHQLTPTLAVLQAQGYKVALVTDGRMSGASGKVPAALHITPETLAGGVLGSVRDGDMIRLDAVAGTLELKVDKATLAKRKPETLDLSDNNTGCGRELFAHARATVGTAEEGGGFV